MAALRPLLPTLLFRASVACSGWQALASSQLAPAVLIRLLRHGATAQALPPWLHRCASSSTASKQLPPGGPAREKLRALPFAVSPAQAEAAFTAYHGSGWLQSRQAPAIRTRKEVYLPFWVGSASVTTTLHSAEVGTSHLVSRYNPATRRYEQQWETRWQRVALQGLSWRQDYSPEAPAMQLYASWKFPRGDIHQLRPGPLVQAATPLTSYMLDASGGGVRHVGPYNMPPGVARKQLRSVVEDAQRARAEEVIRQLMHVTQVRFIDMSLLYAGGGGGPTVAPIYLPAHVFSWVHAGVKVRTYVSGVDGARVAGTKTLDESKVATLAAVAASGTFLVLGVPLGSSAFLWAGLAIPFTLGGLFARYWPALRAFYQSMNAAASEAWSARGAEGAAWDAEYVRAYWRGEGRRQEEERQRPPGGGGFGDSWQQQWQQQWQRQWQWQERQQQGRPPPGGGLGGGAGRAAPARDPKGYYSALGVAPDASQDEVQAAFRGLALKHHPDRYTNEADKKAATRRFQAITAAYHVLRDPGRRRAYDTGMDA